MTEEQKYLVDFRTDGIYHGYDQNNLTRAESLEEVDGWALYLAYHLILADLPPGTPEDVQMKRIRLYIEENT